MATTRESPPTRRTVKVLNLLASDPRARPNLTTIARSLDISASTCLGILHELTVAGFVVRHPDHTYSLGGSLIAVGQAAREGRPGIARARVELAALSEELGAVCTASAVVGDQIVVLDMAGEPGEGAPAVHPGATFPFLAPVGLIFAAWDPDPVIDAWLARSPLAFEPAKLGRLRRVIATARQQGYLVERLTNVEVSLHRFLARGADGGGFDRSTQQALTMALAIFAERDYAHDELAGAQDTSVSVVCAPCFDADGRVELVLGVYVMRAAVRVGEVEALAARLARSCASVTASIGGRDPWRGA